MRQMIFVSSDECMSGSMTARMSPAEAVPTTTPNRRLASGIRGDGGLHHARPMTKGKALGSRSTIGGAGSLLIGADVQPAAAARTTIHSACGMNPHGAICGDGLTPDSEDKDEQTCANTQSCGVHYVPSSLASKKVAEESGRRGAPGKKPARGHEESPSNAIGPINE